MIHIYSLESDLTINSIIDWLGKYKYDYTRVNHDDFYSLFENTLEKNDKKDVHWFWKWKFPTLHNNIPFNSATNNLAFNNIVNNLIKYREKIKYGINLLSVINTKEQPEKLYHFFKNEIRIKSVSFLLPDKTYINTDNPNLSISNWLLRLFDIWYNDNEKFSIKQFEFIIHKILGEDIGNEMFGRKENSVITIKTNGNIEAVDSLKICGNGFTETNLNININNLNEALSVPLINNYYYAHFDDILCSKCKKCNILNICGGGQFAHRYSRENKFNNPSVYCQDIKKTISYIQNIIIDDLPKEIINNTHLNKINL